MKRERYLRSVTAAMGSFLPAFCAAACLLTAFGLNGSLPKLFWSLLVFSLLCGFSLALRRGSLIPLGSFLLVFGRLWYTGALTVQAESLLLNITLRYQGAYGTGLLFPGAENGPWGPVDLPLLALGCLSVFLLCRGLSRGKGSFLPILLPVLQLVACLVVTDTPPHPLALLGLLSGLLALLMTDWVRRRDPGQGLRLLRRTMLPLTALLGILFLLQPQNSYVNRVEEHQEQLQFLVQKFQGQVQDLGKNLSTGTGPTTAAQQVDLKSLGPRTLWNYRMLRVTAPVTDTLYLRGQDYNTYTGTGWTASRHRNEVFAAGGGEVLGELVIEHFSGRELMYLPYYPSQDVTLIGGAAQNSENVRRYRFDLTAPREETEDLSTDEGISDLLVLAGSASGYPDSDYRQLPTDTLRWARELVSQITEGKTATREQAEAIAGYVRSSALYDLDTQRMDPSHRDFAQWFLTEGDTGYCVHFATAATVLLRAANIPARYVEGFMIQTQAGEEITVTGKAAHAWAEYYSDGIWHVLEATPADLSAGETEPMEETENLASTDPSRPEPSRQPRETAPEEDAVPDPDDPAPPEKAGFTMPGWVKGILWCLLAAAVLYAQMWLRRQIKRLLWNAADPNRRCLNRYRQIRLPAKFARLPIPEEAEEAALKAKYSQHSLTEGELEVFDHFRRKCHQAIRSHPLRLALELFLAPEKNP